MAARPSPTRPAARACRSSKLEFTGQVRSLLGPVKGEGSFAIDGQHYPFQLSVSRPADDGGVKVRLNVAPIDHPRTVDVDGSIWVEKGLPRFEGTLQLARPVGRSPDGIVESWRLSSHVRADGAAAVLEQVELQYGPDERAIRLKGDAKLSFGAKPELVATLSASQIDLDRILALPEAAGRRPLVAIRTLAESLVRSQRLPVAVKLGISVETVTLAGAMLQRVGGDLRSEGDSWNIENFALRAPGLTQVAFSGRLGASPGRRRLQRCDQDRIRRSAGADRLARGSPQRAGRGLGGAASHQRCRARRRQDRASIGCRRSSTARRSRAVSTMLGRTVTGPPSSTRRCARPNWISIARNRCVLASLGQPFEWPREGTLAIDIGRTTVGGVEAKDIAVQMRRDTGGLDIERLAIGDIGGAKLTVSGRIDTHESAPRGTLALDLDARSLDGMAALVGKFSGPVADRIRRIASRAVPLKLHTIACAGSGCRRRVRRLDLGQVQAARHRRRVPSRSAGRCGRQPLGIRRSGAARLDQDPPDRGHRCQRRRRAGRHARARSPRHGQSTLGAARARAERAARWRLGGQRHARSPADSMFRRTEPCIPRATAEPTAQIALGPPPPMSIPLRSATRPAALVHADGAAHARGRHRHACRPQRHAGGRRDQGRARHRDGGSRCG